MVKESWFKMAKKCCLKFKKSGKYCSKCPMKEALKDKDKKSKSKKLNKKKKKDKKDKKKKDKKKNKSK